jgi:hypothetical protein
LKDGSRNIAKLECEKIDIQYQKLIIGGEKMFTKDIVVLSISRRYGGNCVAGKVFQGEDKRKWIRPVSELEHEELPRRLPITGNNPLELLDVVSVPLERKTSNPDRPYQTENYLMGNGFWKTIGTLSEDDIPSLCDECETLWRNEEHEGGLGQYDRVSATYANQNIHDSLRFIKPEDLEINVQREAMNRKKLRACFTYKGIYYKLAVTDRKTEKALKSQGEDLSFQYNDKTYLCVSLGEPYNGFCYKLVAGVLEIQ